VGPHRGPAAARKWTAGQDAIRPEELKCNPDAEKGCMNAGDSSPAGAAGFLGGTRKISEIYGLILNSEIESR